MMETTEIKIDSKFQSNLKSLIDYTLEEQKRIEKSLDFLYNNNTSQSKKKKV